MCSISARHIASLQFIIITLIVKHMVSQTHLARVRRIRRWIHTALLREKTVAKCERRLLILGRGRESIFMECVIAAVLV